MLLQVGAVNSNPTIAHAIGFDAHNQINRRLNIDVNIIFVGFDKDAGETHIPDEKITKWFGKLHKELLHADTSFKNTFFESFNYDFHVAIGRMNSRASAFVHKFIRSQRLNGHGLHNKMIFRLKAVTISPL